jgi:AraC-like DNA-binding protein
MLHKEVLIRLTQARDLLRETEDRTYSVRQVARATGMSPYHFIRLFKAVFGETPKQCQLHARVEKAKHLLVVTDSSVTDICLDTGFSSLGTFSYVFARRVGMAPTGYRQKVRSMTHRRGEIPHQLIPGCFSLMCGSPE